MVEPTLAIIKKKALLNMIDNKNTLKTNKRNVETETVFKMSKITSNENDSFDTSILALSLDFLFKTTTCMYCIFVSC